MRVISFISQKGGTGKTTLAIHLATAFVAGGYNTALLDLDPQASAAEWKDARDFPTPPVIAVPAARLQKVIEEVKAAGTEVLIIDTAPHSESSTLAALRAADLILVPCQPSVMDLRALRKTAELLAHVKKPVYAVLNGVSVHGSVSDGAARAITKSFDMPVADARIATRVAYNRCLITGRAAQEYEPTGKAAREIAKFYKWVCRRVDTPTRKQS
jgi:chromosome partitioning protein